MDAHHARLARVGLAAVGRFGFCLAGGYAVQAHGMVERPSEDVDLFTTAAAERDFPAAVDAAIDAYRADGLEATVLARSATYARLAVADPVSRATAKVEMAIDWRAHDPVSIDIGPVLHPDDAVANKVGALYSRAQARDYIDVDAAVASGRYLPDDLLRLAAEHDPGFDPARFVEAVRAVRRLPMAEFVAYGLTESEAAELVDRLLSWATTIADKTTGPENL